MTKFKDKTMSNQNLQTRPSNQSQAPATIEQLVRNSTYTARFNEVLKDRAPQFMASIISVGREMADVEPKSIIASAMKAAVLNLPIEKSFGFAWLVPYKDGNTKYCQFQMGHKGFIQLALRTGQYTRMNARAINKEALLGVDDVGEPIIDWNNIDPDKEAAHYVFAFKLVNGFSKIACWSKKRVQAHASRYSQSYKSGYNSPWKTNFDEMALKTVVKNELSDWGILSVDVANALQADQSIQRTPESELEYLDVPKHDPGHQIYNEAPKVVVQAPAPPKPKATEPKQAKVTPEAPKPAPAPAPSLAMAAMMDQSDPLDGLEQVPNEPVGEPAPMPEPESEEWSVQGELKKFCLSNQFGLIMFVKYAKGVKLIPADAEIGEWSDIPKEVAVRCLRSKNGIVAGMRGIA